ncbi:hypothetical protein U1Q18_045566 [Sarracenia purpurea var. burkii]
MVFVFMMIVAGLMVALEDEEKATGSIADSFRRLKMNRIFSSMATWVRCSGLPWYQSCKVFFLLFLNCFPEEGVQGLLEFLGMVLSFLTSCWLGFVIFGSLWFYWFRLWFSLVLFSNGFTLISCANRLSSIFDCMSLGLFFDENGVEFL